MSDDLRFQMMGLGGPPVGAPAAAAPAPAKAPAGQDTGYPTLYAVIGEKAKTDAFLAAAAKSKAKLDEITKGADAKAKADARKALIAFDHAISFVKTGAQLVEDVKKQQAAKGKPKAGAKK